MEGDGVGVGEFTRQVAEEK